MFEDPPFRDEELEACSKGQCCQCGLCCVVSAGFCVPLYDDELCQGQPMECFKGPLTPCPNLHVSQTQRRLLCILHGKVRKPEQCTNWSGDKMTILAGQSVTEYENLCVFAGRWIAYLEAGNRNSIKIITEFIERGSLSLRIRNHAQHFCEKDPVATMRHYLAQARSLPTEIFEFIGLKTAIAASGKARCTLIDEAGLNEHNELHREFIREYLPEN